MTSLMIVGREDDCVAVGEMEKEAPPSAVGVDEGAHEDDRIEDDPHSLVSLASLNASSIAALTSASDRPFRLSRSGANVS